MKFNLGKLTSAAFLLILVASVVTGLTVDSFSWFMGLASGVSLWQLLFRHE